MSTVANHPDETRLRDTLKENPADWETRKQLAHLLYDQGSFEKAADIIWAVDEIPSIDIELAFAARILAKAAPRKAIRLLNALLEHNQGKAVQNLGLANALLHHGMVLQAARFYGAALEADPSLGNPDLEHFILWTDDEETLWGNFSNRRPVLGELPWMKRDPMEALKLTSRISTHTTPIKLPSLKAAPGEDLKNDLYQQTAAKGAEPTPPPAVTIPMDRVEPKDRLFDDELGAPAPSSGQTTAATPVKRKLAEPDFSAAGQSQKPVPVPATDMLEQVMDEEIELEVIAPAEPVPAAAIPAPVLPPPGGPPKPTLPPAGGPPKPTLPLPGAPPTPTLPVGSAPPMSKPKPALPPLKKV